MHTTYRSLTATLIPAGAFQSDCPLVAVMRGEYVQSVHRGIACVTDTDGSVVFALGDPAQPVFLRSAAKPFQVMPALLTGAIDRFEVTDRELAVLCASHSAQEFHIDTVLGVLARAGLDEVALRCGIHPPIHEGTAKERARRGIEPSPVCNNCSGAHTGMLLACEAMGWPLETYGDPAHPLQALTRDVLGSFAGVEPSGIRYATDNCAVPTFLLPLRNAALAFARLATGSGISAELATAAQRVRNAMMAHPEMVAGEGRFDTELMEATAGTLVCKGGAEAFQGIGLPREGLGIAFKITDGNPRAVPPTSLSLLSALGAIGADVLPAQRSPIVRNPLGEQVGHLESLVRVEPAA